MQDLFGRAHGTAVVVDFRTRRVMAAHREEVARRMAVAPGSTVKPFVLLALLESGRLRPDEGLPCGGRVVIAGRSFTCAHPAMGTPMQVRTALAYSCNTFVADAARRLERGELAKVLERAGFRQEGRAEEAEANRLWALGDGGVQVTALELALAYRRLASAAPPAVMEGLEGAVEFGTAQRAAVPGVKVAGKTGSAGAHWAWFAGFAPSRAPRAVVAVLVQGRSGGGDAAPIGGRILAAYLEGRL